MTRKTSKRLALGLGAASAIAISTMAVKDTKALSAGGEPAPATTISAGAAERLAGAIRIPTISHVDSAAFEGRAFAALHDYLQAQFPRVHEQLRREKIATHSVLYTWTGSDSTQKPILLMGHLDVVPVEKGTESQWQADPFSGRIADGFIWGRGAIDNKSAVVGTLEAVEQLLSSGFRPARTIYLAFGHDEEVGGKQGARAIAETLKQRGVQLELVLDEGGVIGEGIMPVSAPTALVGVAEKGFVSIELTTKTAGGHSSLPPRQSAVGILSAAIATLEQNPLPARLDGATQQMFERISSEFPFVQRALFANLWLTRPLLLGKLAGNPTTNAMIRTTTAATIFQAGTKENVLPSYARAVINFRILPGDSVASVLRHVEEVIDDPRVNVRVAPGFTAEPSAVASTDSESFRTLERTIRSLDPAAIVAPYLVVVVTDSRYYAELTENVLRFLPVRVAPQDLQRMHGTNERISVRDYEWAIRFYGELMKNVAGS